MKAIDLYAGVGGWSLGLAMAGLEVTESYEWWQPAIDTHKKNLGSKVHGCDIRQLELDTLPPKVEVVVGSPPCTQFSFSNRGGAGDIADGLVDIEKFLEVVTFLRPRFWAMENVPRVKEILDRHLGPKGRLKRFNDLQIQSMVIDMSEFGLPQRRRRCIAGNFDFKLLLSYRKNCNHRTLGNVLKALAAGTVTDPVYGNSYPRAEITDHVPEAPLNQEETRMNREAKVFHPVYNNMAFPDPLKAPVRTITATCTRVSRESIVVRAPESPQILRRLTVRERASLQGFPVSYKFFSNSYAQKLKMVGNAIPPLMVFYIAQAMQGISPKSLMQPSAAISRFRPSLENPPATPPEGEGQTYPSSRSFRAAIAGLRFKSGVRFEISNAFGPEKDVRWRVRFYFGNSKDIRECTLDKALLGKCRQRVIGHDGWAHIDSDLTHLLSFVEKINAQSLQDTWSHRREGVSPFDLVDEAGDAAQRVLLQLEKLKIPTAKIETFVVDVLGLNAKARKKSKGDYSRKVRRFAMAIFSGFIVGATLNLALEQNRFSTRKMTRQERLVA